MDFGRIDNVKMAESCGVEALRTANPGELAAAVRRAIEQGKSLVAAVPIHYADYRKLF
jgi:thiamine pyrophosphate-dependent acetolactate synthase large subunit-like protein